MGFPIKLAKAKQLAIYWDNYVNYLSNADEQQPNIGNGTSKPPQTEVYVQPFGIDLDAEQFIKVNATQDRWNTWGSQFAAYTQDTLNTAGGEVFLRLRGVRPARLVIKTGISTTKTVVTAKATKRKYLSYGGTSGSIPFGQNTTESEVEAFQTLKAAVESTGFNAQTMRISRVKEVA